MRFFAVIDIQLIKAKALAARASRIEHDCLRAAGKAYLPWDTNLRMSAVKEMEAHRDHIQASSPDAVLEMIGIIEAAVENGMLIGESGKPISTRHIETSD